MTEAILVERLPESAGVQIIRLNRPEKKNAITRTMYAAMTDALRRAEDDDAVRAHVILGAPGSFSAGNDMSDFLAFAMGGSLGAEVLDFLKTLATLEKPVVSGVDGLAIGIGTTIHLHCDLTFATPASQFRTPFVDLALVPEAASSLLVPAIAGHQRAFALLAAGIGFSAEEARDAGLIYKVLEASELEPTVLAHAQGLASKPPQAMRIARQLMRGPRDAVLSRIDEEARHFAAQLKSDEAKASFQAFMARKK